MNAPSPAAELDSADISVLNAIGALNDVLTAGFSPEEVLALALFVSGHTAMAEISTATVDFHLNKLHATASD